MCMRPMTLTSRHLKLAVFSVIHISSLGHKLHITRVMNTYTLFLLLVSIGICQSSCSRSWTTLDCRGSKFIDLTIRPHETLIVDDTLLYEELRQYLDKETSIVVWGQRFCPVLCYDPAATLPRVEHRCQCKVINLFYPLDLVRGS